MFLYFFINSSLPEVQIRRKGRTTTTTSCLATWAEEKSWVERTRMRSALALPRHPFALRSVREDFRRPVITPISAILSAETRRDYVSRNAFDAVVLINQVGSGFLLVFRFFLLNRI